jgi:hypothetical protein
MALGRYLDFITPTFYYITSLPVIRAAIVDLIQVIAILIGKNVEVGHFFHTALLWELHT